MNIVTIVGARPQFVKAAVVSQAIRRRPGLTESIIHTGQHYDPEMSDCFFRDLGIPAPAHELEVGSGRHGDQTAAMLSRIEGILMAQPPDWVLVYGDTNSTLAGALAAAKLHLPVAHVEAGLRSFNRRMPEEINRVLTDHLASRLFAPTPTAVTHLAAEGIRGSHVELVGDVMFDAARHFSDRADRVGTVLADHHLASRAYALATLHRAENTDDPARLATLLSGLARVARELPVVLPLHPRTRKVIANSGLAHLLEVAGIHRLPPVGYLDMTCLERHAAVIATDSGGVQKEAYFHGVPCVTLRDQTEWTELVEAGWNRLCPADSALDIAAAILRAVGTSGRPIPDYGTGHASDLIAASLARGPA